VLDFDAIGGGDGPPPALDANPLVAPMDTGDASPSPAADNGVLGAVLGAAQAIANVVQPQPAAMRFTRRPADIPAEPAPSAVRYARSGGGLGWAKIPTQFDTELEVRWFDGRLFAKVTAESIPPLAPFIKADGDTADSWRRRIAWLNKQKLHCEAYPRTDKKTCVMEWRALQRLLSVRNLTDAKGQKDKSPCVPATQYDADDLYTWEEWAQQVRALQLRLEKPEGFAVSRHTDRLDRCRRTGTRLGSGTRRSGTFERLPPPSAPRIRKVARGTPNPPNPARANAPALRIRSKSRRGNGTPLGRQTAPHLGRA